MLESVSSEVSVENFIEFMELMKKVEGEISYKRVYEFLINSILGINPLANNFLSFQINLKEENKIETLKIFCEAYLKYIQGTLRSRIKLIFNIFEKEMFLQILPYILDIIESGGNVMIVVEPTETVSYIGIRKSFSSTDIVSAGTIILHSLAVNLPRLAYAGAEETFLKSLLKIKLQKAHDAVETRRNNLINLMEKEILYLYEYNNELFSKNFLSIVNLVGLDELAKFVASQDEEEQNRMWIKFMEFSKKVLEECGKGAGLRVLPAVYVDDSSRRFYDMDRENIPKEFIEKINAGRYSQTPVLDIKDIGNESLIRRLQSRIGATDGGYHVILDVSTDDGDSLLEDSITEAISKLSVIKIRKKMISCATCGTKSMLQSRCPKCGSAKVLVLQTDN
ncbi:MAG: hypothetical protein H5T50_03740 [Nitrososphaeria archaeon]|nr:hypothetical protein [Nitrososphaeria archaeon]